MNYTLDDLQKNFKKIVFNLYVQLEIDYKDQKSIPESELEQTSFEEIPLSSLPEPKRELLQFLRDTLITVTAKYNEVEGQIKKLQNGSEEQQHLKETQSCFIAAYCAALDIVSKFGEKTLRAHSILTIEIQKFFSTDFTITDRAWAYNSFKKLTLLQPEIFFNVSSVKRGEILAYTIKYGNKSNEIAIDSFEVKEATTPNISRFVKIHKTKQDDSHFRTNPNTETKKHIDPVAQTKIDPVTQTKNLIALTIASQESKHKGDENMGKERRIQKHMLEKLKELLIAVHPEEAKVLYVFIRGIMYSIALSSHTWSSITHEKLAKGLGIDELDSLEKFRYLQLAYKFLENQLLVVSSQETSIRETHLFSFIEGFEVKKLLKQLTKQLYAAFQEYIQSPELNSEHEAKFLELHPIKEKPSLLNFFKPSPAGKENKTKDVAEENDQENTFILP